MRPEGPLALFVGLAAASVALGPTMAPAQVAGPAGGASPRVLIQQFAWEDPNIRHFVQWTPDGRPFTNAPMRHEVTARIDQDLLERRIAEFGVPTARPGVIEGRSDEEVQAKLAAGGMRFAPDGSIQVDYRKLIRESRGDVLSLTEALIERARRAGYDDVRDLVGLFASFVQALRYVEPPKGYRRADGQFVSTAGCWVPLDVLKRQAGDCDSKCALFGALFASVPATRMVILIGEGHAFVGVAAPPRPGDRFTTHRGVRYVLIELTSPFSVGEIAPEMWTAVRRRRMRVERLL